MNGHFLAPYIADGHKSVGPFQKFRLDYFLIFHIKIIPKIDDN